MIETSHNYTYDYSLPRPSDPLATLCRHCHGTDEKDAYSLTTECPRVPLTDQQRAGIIRGVINFIGGKWVRQPHND